MKYTIVSFVTLLIASCNTATEAPAETTEAVVVEQKHNTLTDAEIVDGWELMFDGQCTANFRKYGDKVIGKAWVIQDEALHLDASNKEDWQTNGGGDIVYQDFDSSLREFENFHFKGEWKIAERGNSGIIYLIHEDTEKYPYCWMSGLEMQVLDNGTDSNEGHPDAVIYKHRAGDLYDINAASGAASKLAGEWNKFEIIVQDGHLTQILNGVVTVDRQLFDDQWRIDVAASKFHQWAGYGTYTKGGIALQDHGDDVWYRNLKIKSLENDAAEAEEAAQE
ncbi:MAG TPA: DUF1080 domain-containing protein [Cryomorphaceae bacterium]|nr:DUF1080 domain-containing protein [Cryomorphaceae bacterium]|tara:strand:- start:1222 stop:2058 length:837 start_codon:yes stop_codon:yes gene_type:complete